MHEDGSDSQWSLTQYGSWRHFLPHTFHHVHTHTQGNKAKCFDITGVWLTSLQEIMTWTANSSHLLLFCILFSLPFFFFFLGHKSWKLWRHLCYWNRHNSVWRKSRAKRFKQIYWEHFWSEQWIYFLNKRESKVKMLNFRKKKKKLYIFHKRKCPC